MADETPLLVTREGLEQILNGVPEAVEAEGAKPQAAV